MLTFFYIYKSFNGSLTHILDAYYNYNKNKQLIIYTKIDKSLLFNICYNKFNININNDIFNNLTSSFPFYIENCCCTFSILKYLLINKLKLAGKTIILFDNGGMFSAYINKLIDTYLYEIYNILQYDNIYILASESNIRFINKFKNIIQYDVKLSEYRLNNVLIGNNGKCISSKEYGTYKYKDPSFNLHKYSSYIYSRWDEIIPGIFFEDLGKSLFEFIYYNKQVIYNNNNKALDDGLTYKLRKFGIDDNTNNLVLSNIIKKHDIEREFISEDIIINSLI